MQAGFPMRPSCHVRLGHMACCQCSAFLCWARPICLFAVTGFPPFDHAGFKIGKFGHLGETADPDCLNREVNAADEACLREAVTEYFPLAGEAFSFSFEGSFRI